MGKDLEVTDRTVKRDIEYMRDRHGAPIEYDELQHGYYYRTEFELLPVAAMTGAELFSLLVADKAIAQYRGMPFQKPLRMAFKKLTGQLDNPDALRRPQSKNKVCTDKEFVSAVLGNNSLATKAIRARAKEVLDMSPRSADRYLARNLAWGVICHSGGLYWAANQEVTPE